MKERPMYLPRMLSAAALCAALSATTAFGHEMWIEPQTYQVENGAAILGDFKNGEEFAGNSLSYFDRSSARYDLAVGDTVTPIEARAGDRPALNIADAPQDALVAVLHETTASKLTYRKWEKFLKFAKHKDFPDAAADHLAAGWPQEGFRESYTRHVKSLIAVGSGAGADQTYGLETEFTALTNPYAPDFDGMMRVALTYDGAPRADAQVEVFDRAPDDSVTVSLHRTDAQGVAAIPVTAGHDYLFDAVVLRPAKGAGETQNAPVWRTLWAALTFGVPQ